MPIDEVNFLIGKADVARITDLIDAVNKAYQAQKEKHHGARQQHLSSAYSIGQDLCSMLVRANVISVIE